MGWTYTTRPAGIRDIDFFAHIFNPLQIIALSKNSNEHAIYMAIRIPFGKYEGKITAVVMLYDIARRKECGYGYKELPEEFEPFFYSCPIQILNMLSPVEELFDGESRERARKWRETCYLSQGKPDNQCRLL